MIDLLKAVGFGFLKLQSPETSQFDFPTAMAKNRNKKKKTGAVSMDITDPGSSNAPEAMDTSETGVTKPASADPTRKVQKGRPMKRSKSVRKTKAIMKAISKGEKTDEKVSKRKDKSVRILSAKQLYD